MKLTQEFTNEHAAIDISTQWQFIRITWLQHTEQAPLRHVLEKALEIARPAQIHHWLFDLRKLNYTMLSDQIWSATKFFPSFDLTLNHRLACVINPHSTEMFPDMAIQNSIQQNEIVSEKIELEIFESLEMAKSWLFD